MQSETKPLDLQSAVVIEELGRDPARLEGFRALIAGYVRGRVRSAEDCEDVVQTVFMRAASKLDTFRGDCPLSQWLLRIALNELRIYYSRVLPKSQGLVSLSEFSEENAPTVQRSESGAHPEGRGESADLAQRLLDAARLACTSPEFRVMAMFYRGESFERIADLLEMRSGTVRSHFLRGRANLIAYLVERDPELLGGVAAITAAAEKAMATTDPSDRLDARERECFANLKQGKIFRSACLKVARFLPLPVLLVILVEVL